MGAYTRTLGVNMSVRIIDWDSMRQVGLMKFHKGKSPDGEFSTGFSQSAIAVSADGRFILILVDTKLRLFQIAD
jgi:hypothetical protein